MTKVIVYHASYGCDSGCCGHQVEVDGVGKGFTFDHPYDLRDEERTRAWAPEIIEAKFGEDHGLDLDWENCLIGDD